MARLVHFASLCLTIVMVAPVAATTPAADPMDACTVAPRTIDEIDRLAAQAVAPSDLGLEPYVISSAALTAQVEVLNRREIRLDKLHLGTGQVSLPAFVRMLITEFEVVPLWSEFES